VIDGLAMTGKPIDQAGDLSNVRAVGAYMGAYIRLVSQSQEDILVDILVDRADIENQAHNALHTFTTPRRHPLHDWETVLLQHGSPLQLANGLVARTFGDGPLVLLVHGWEGRGINLGKFIAPLVDAGYQPIALDGPAHGESPGETMDPAHFAQGIIDAGNELGPLAGVIAHSGGGASTALALKQGLMAQRVVLIAAFSSLIGVLQRFAQLAQLPQPVAERFYRLYGERMGMPDETFDIARISATLTTPALIIHDAADTYIPVADARAIAASWSGARLYVTNGLGHKRILHDAAVLAAAVSFLRGGTPHPNAIDEPDEPYASA
jgi:pimeloyl-ACP methyl ester carboxylesterase